MFIFRKCKNHAVSLVLSFMLKKLVICNESGDKHCYDSQSSSKCYNTVITADEDPNINCYGYQSRYSSLNDPNV